MIGLLEGNNQSLHKKQKTKAEKPSGKSQSPKMASNVGPTCHKDQFLNSNISTVNIIGERDGETGEDLPTEESK